MKILFSIILVILLLLPTNSFSEDRIKQENRGVSFILSMCSDKALKQKKLFENAYKDATILNAGWMYGATSNPDTCRWAPIFLKDPRPKRIRIHVCNSTCFPERGRKCQAKECFANMTASQASKAVLNKDTQTYKRIDRIIQMVKKDYNGNEGGVIQDFAISSCLECTLTREARKKLNEYIKKEFSDINTKRVKEGLNEIAYVDNPYGDSCLEDYLCEKHGTPTVGKKGIADNDGVDYDVIDQISYWENNTEAYMVLAWKPCLNGLTGKESGFIAPQNRSDYCIPKREGKEFSIFTDASLDLTIDTPEKKDYKAKDLSGCAKYHDIDFVWKLADGERNFTTWVAPAKFNKFKKVQLLCNNGEIIDNSYPQIGYRFGSPYTHDSKPQRKIYDFRKMMDSYPDNCVLHADSNCWLMPRPYFRPVKK